MLTLGIVLENIQHRITAHQRVEIEGLGLSIKSTRLDTVMRLPLRYSVGVPSTKMSPQDPKTDPISGDENENDNEDGISKVTIL
jgi:hypothetical protein